MTNASPIKVHFTLNEQEVEVTAYPMARLLDVLREQLRHTGAKEGCGEGECGSCTIFLNGRATNSCLVPLAQLEGASVITVEHLSNLPLGKKLQEAFLKHNGAQCGICTPGMLIAAYELLQRQPNPSLAQVQEGLSGNLCRCTGYKKIYDAVLEAAQS